MSQFKFIAGINQRKRITSKGSIMVVEYTDSTNKNGVKVLIYCQTELAFCTEKNLVNHF